MKISLLPDFPAELLKNGRMRIDLGDVRISTISMGRRQDRSNKAAVMQGRGEVKSMKLYDYLPSGNSYKVRLLLSYMGVSYTHVPIDIHAGETQTPEYLAMNPAGQIPVLQLDDGRTLAESNAILMFLAEDTPYVPINAFERAKALQWMFWEQYRHEPAIAVARFIRIYAPERKAELPVLMEKGNAALSVMEEHLRKAVWFVGAGPGLADIALYAYTHVAGEGGFNLGDYPQVQAWCERMAEHPRHILITDTPKVG